MIDKVAKAFLLIIVGVLIGSLAQLYISNESSKEMEAEYETRIEQLHQSIGLTESECGDSDGIYIAPEGGGTCLPAGTRIIIPKSEQDEPDDGPTQVLPYTGGVT